jgi:Xaa-Pro aminopeptidase
VDKRCARLARQFRGAGIDALFVSSEPNVSYLSGFKGTESFLFITPHRRYFLTDFRYAEQARRETRGFKVLVRNGASYADMAEELRRRERCRRVGFESPRTTHAFYRQLERALGAGALVPTSGLVERLRAVKDAGELRKIRNAVAIMGEGIRRLRATAAPGMNEKEIQGRLEYETKMLGSEKPAFDIIIAAGAKSSMPHAVSDHLSRLRENDILLVDMGVVSEGYHSDLTRCFFLGKIPRPMRKIYDTVLEAQERGIRAVRPGRPAREVDAACRDFIRKKGYGRYFGHGTGHGVGLEIHEAPSVSGRSSDVLAPGMVVTVEPGIYLPGRFGVRIEDMVLVTAKGHEVLTRDIDKRI